MHIQLFVYLIIGMLCPPPPDRSICSDSNFYQQSSHINILSFGKVSYLFSNQLAIELCFRLKELSVKGGVTLKDIEIVIGFKQKF